MRIKSIAGIQFVIGFVALGFLISGLAFGRPVRRWSYEELDNASDLVVIGSALSTRDAANYVYENPSYDTWVAVDTVFVVSAVLKGNSGRERLTLRHNRFHDPRGELSIDGPTFAEFSPGLKHTYLMFLKKGADPDLDYYEPVTGQYDTYDSFWLLEGYHIVNERVKKDEAASPDDQNEAGELETGETAGASEAK